MGLVTLPLTFAIFRRLPDRGYAFAKPVGLLVISLVAWWIGNLKWLPFTGLTCWVALVGVGLASNAALLFNRRLGREMAEWFSRRKNWNLVIAAELVFLLGYAFIINMRSFFPALNQSEKFFDYAFINVIAASPDLPPPDPWFAGQPMNYYYGGQLLMGVMSKMTGTEVSTGYNIAMGLVYALGAIGAYGLGSNLVGMARGRGQASLGGGLLGVAFIQVLGNLYPLRQVFVQGLLPTSDKNFPFLVPWPASARMIYDPMPDGRMLDILTEYPIYSYLNGDLHAHLLGAPYVLVALAWIINLFGAARRKWALARPDWREVGHFLAGGMFVGGLYFINGGDFPTYLLLAIVGLRLAEGRDASERWLRVLGRVAVQLVGFGVGLWLVYFFYFQSFNGMIRGKPIADVADTPVIGFMSRYVGWISWPRTNLSEYVQMFGLFFLPILTFMILKLIGLARDERRTEVSPLGSWVRAVVGLIGLILLVIGGLGLLRAGDDFSHKNLSLTSLVAPVIALTGVAWTLWPRAWASLRSQPRLAVEGMAALVLLGVGPLVKFELLGPVTVLLYFAVRIGWRDLKRTRRQDSWLTRLDTFAGLLVALAAAVTLFCELFYVRDIYANRFNTMFKFWYQLWVLFGVAGIYTAWRVVKWGATLDVAVTDEVQPVETAAGAIRRSPTLVNGLVGLWPFRVGRRLAGVEGMPLPNLALTQLQPGSAGASVEQVEPDRGVRLPSEPSAGWRWGRRMWIGVLVVLMIGATAVPTLAYWQTTNHYTARQGLNGETWYAEAFPAEYPAMRWLREYTRQDPARRGVVLEANGMNYSWGDRISTYTGLPTVVGWPFHELQWRGNLPELQIWDAWLDMDRIYATTDIEEAKRLLLRHDVRYVFVGQAENGTRSLYSDNHEYKRFAPEALAKFGLFMHTIYADPANNIFIYAFN